MAHIYGGTRTWWHTYIVPQHYLYTQYICTYMTANAHIYNITTYCRPGDTPFDIEPTPIQKGCFCAAHIHHITLYVCIHTNISDHLLETKKKQKKSPHTAILETQHPAKPIKKSRFVHHWPSSTLVECKHLIHILKCQLHTATHCNTLQQTATHYWPSSTLCESKHVKSAPHC